MNTRNILLKIFSLVKSYYKPLIVVLLIFSFSSVAIFYTAKARIKVAYEQQQHYAQMRINSLNKQIAQLQHALSLQMQDNKISDETTQGLQKRIKQLEQENSTLIDEAGLYKIIMGQQSAKRLINIRSIKLTPQQDKGKYSYIIRLSKDRLGKKSINGTVKLKVHYKTELGLEEQFAIKSETDQTIDDVELEEQNILAKFSIKNFQEIKGDFCINNDHEPVAVTVVLEPEDPKLALAEQHFPWKV